LSDLRAITSRARFCRNYALRERIEQLKQLGELRDSKVLTDAEFEAEKKKILGNV